MHAGGDGKNPVDFSVSSCWSLVFLTAILFMGGKKKTTLCFSSQSADDLVCSSKPLSQVLAMRINLPCVSRASVSALFRLLSHDKGRSGAPAALACPRTAQGVPLCAESLLLLRAPPPRPFSSSPKPQRAWLPYVGRLEAELVPLYPAAPSAQLPGR